MGAMGGSASPLKRTPSPAAVPPVQRQVSNALALAEETPAYRVGSGYWRPPLDTILHDMGLYPDQSAISVKRRGTSVPCCRIKAIGRASPGAQGLLAGDR